MINIDENLIFRNSSINMGLSPTLYRFLVADDPKVERFIIRDTDSRITYREAKSIEEWEKSQKKYYLLQDHPNHDVWPM